MSSTSAIVTSQKTIGILGGGISGLAAGHYLKKKFGNTVRPIVFEKSSRVGGWIKSVRKPEQNFTFETGPRTVRPVGLQGKNALDLIEDVGLDKSVWYIDKSHPAAQNRFIFKDKKLIRLPTDISPLFQVHEPFSKPLITSVFRDIFRFRERLYDDSMFNFIERRFGSEVADYVIDPLVRGICAGNAKDVSIKLIFKELFELEQRYGSVLLGYILKNYRHKTDDILTPFEKELGFSRIAHTAFLENWAVYTLENGLETLVERLEEKINEDGNGQVLKDTEVESIKFLGSNKNEACEIVYKGGRQFCHHIISALPAWKFSNLIKDDANNRNLYSLLNQTYGANVAVVNILYKDDDDLLPEQGFGFLVPSKESKKCGVPGLLGVVFDTCAFPQGGHTLLTLMFELNSGQLNMNELDLQSNLLKRSRDYIKTSLNLDRPFDDYNISLAKDSIPQYTIGHFERNEAARKFISVSKLPLSLIGASYDGASVNDCILSARRAVYENLPDDL